ncbi:MAG: type II toxin-antitoxin system RelE/ParE family toxin [Gemmatimonadaceae bacterium]|nr:type II toxin-antitoxin system RelE/ParE family toxin [Gemmatimonadaceae bacterium]
MRLTFHPQARDEFVAAADYYESAVPGLGNRFLLSVRRATNLALMHPDAGTARAAVARRILVHGFPYDVIYRVRGEELEVLAVAHQHRRPGYWRDRLPG